MTSVQLIANTAQLRPFNNPGSPQRHDPWAAVEGMDTFLSADDPEVDWLIPNILAPGILTEIFAPRGLGKTMAADFWAVTLASRGLNVLILDRDNPSRTLRARLRGFGAEGLGTLKTLARDKCPPLTKPHEWETFPYTDYDLVIVDSLDSMAEGIGEQESGKPARAMAPLLDVCHRDHGPAVLLLGNTVRNGSHSRGSGVIEDRADIVYEVRDATGFRPRGERPWIEELPLQGAESWANRSGRRKQRQTFRLAFSPSKFRVGEEPAPFILEVDLTGRPWALKDVTAEVDAAGEAQRQCRIEETASKHRNAVHALSVEIERRREAGEAEMNVRGAEAFLMDGSRYTQVVARMACHDPAFSQVPVVGRGNPKVIRASSGNSSDNTKTHHTEAA